MTCMEIVHSNICMNFRHNFSKYIFSSLEMGRDLNFHESKVNMISHRTEVKVIPWNAKHSFGVWIFRESEFTELEIIHIFVIIPESSLTIKCDMRPLLKCPCRHHHRRLLLRLQQCLLRLRIVLRSNVLRWVKIRQLRWFQIQPKMASFSSWCTLESTTDRWLHWLASSIFSAMFRYVSSSKIHQKLLKPSLIRLETIATTSIDSLGDIR